MSVNELMFCLNGSNYRFLEQEFPVLGKQYLARYLNE